MLDSALAMEPMVVTVNMCERNVIKQKLPTKFTNNRNRSEAVEYSSQLRILLVAFVLLHFHTYGDSDSHKHAALEETIFVLFYFLAHVDSDSHRLQC